MCDSEVNVRYLKCRSEKILRKFSTSSHSMNRPYLANIISKLPSFFLFSWFWRCRKNFNMQSRYVYVAGASVAILSMVSLALQRKYHINLILKNQFTFMHVLTTHMKIIYCTHTRSHIAYYVNQCARNDPEVNTCLLHSANRLARLLQVGVPELGMEEVKFQSISLI